MNKNNLKNLELKQKALEHYNRMITWVEKKIKEDESFAHDIVLHQVMEDEIKESWYSSFCIYCLTLGYCNLCPLHQTGRSNTDTCCDGLWQELELAETWTDWLYAAKKVREYIEANG